MAETFQFDLVSPERSILSGPALMVTVPGMEGDFGVLKGHAPFMSTLRPGIVEIQRGNGEALKVFVSGGFADVTPAGLTLLADDAIEASELDGEIIDKLVAVAEADKAHAADDQAKAAIDQRLRDLEQVRTQLRA
ncbi:MAG: F0F1 ATP synthase subunit epsilon [Alphaproteobacteria bacterium]